MNMFTKPMMALSAAIVVATASAGPAVSASSKSRHVAAPQHAYGQSTRTRVVAFDDPPGAAWQTRGIIEDLGQVPVWTPRGYRAYRPSRNLP
jgi:hypothetical protein